MILQSLSTLRKIEDVKDILPLNTYRAAQRDVLRSLVKNVVNQTNTKTLLDTTRPDMLGTVRSLYEGGVVPK